MFDPKILAGRSILVTGGGSGLGLAMAKTFAAHGAQVTIAGRRREKLEAAAVEIAAAARESGEAAFLDADIRDPEAAQKLVAVRGVALRQARRPRQQRRGQLPRLLRGAHAQRLRRRRAHGPLRLGPLHARRRAAPARRARPRAPIVSIATTYAWTGTAFALPSACAKAGVLAMTRSLAVEWGHAGIRLNAIAPGPIPTEGAFSRLIPNEQAEKARRSDAFPSRASAARRRSRTSRPSCSRTSAPTRPATASRWTAASGSPAPASSRTTARSPARC